VLGLHPVVAFLVGAILTPTDPIVASSIVQGPLAKKALPARLRHLLSAESGANDGLAVLFVLAPILLLTHLAGPAEAWALEALVRKAVLSVLFGAALGYVAALVFAWASDHDDMEVASHMGYTLALAILTLAAGELLHLNGVLAVFVAGIAFTLRTDSSRQKEEENVQEAVNLFFTLPAFALLGLVLPWEGWLKLGWKGLLLAGLVLALRRLPAVFLLRRWLGGMRAPRDYLWYGWFGPIGASAAFYAAEAHERTGLTEVWDVATLVIVASLVAHGVTSGPWARAYGRRAGRLAAGDERGASGGDQGKEERSAKGSAQA
ncbi:MAG TPA: cation:proton antiporter, partial [Candidatus Thermoplasmatota archaeon]|nr:cation:proton antiporter [Candidatus Thermoplasmatota archaeon]